MDVTPRRAEKFPDTSSAMRYNARGRRGYVRINDRHPGAGCISFAYVGRLCGASGEPQAGTIHCTALTLLGYAGSAGLVVLLLTSGVEVPATSRWASLLPGKGPCCRPCRSIVPTRRSRPTWTDRRRRRAAGHAGAWDCRRSTTANRDDATLGGHHSRRLLTSLHTRSNHVLCCAAGDTLRSIAEQLGVSVQALLDANDLDADAGDQLGIGQELRIPVDIVAGAVEATIVLPEPTPTLSEPTLTPSEPTPTLPEPTATEPPPPTLEPPTATPEPPVPTRVPPTPTRRPVVPTPRPEPPSSEVRTYIVKQGDTLRSIATQFGVSVDVLLRFNGLSAAQGDQLKPGQQLSIPANAPRPTAVVRRYVVEPGDTLRGIAAQFDVTVDALLRFNGLTPAEGDQIRPGQTLLIPGS